VSAHSSAFTAFAEFPSGLDHLIICMRFQRKQAIIISYTPPTESIEKWHSIEDAQSTFQLIAPCCFHTGMRGGQRVKEN
jgi:hypothetical protein